ncbi:MAG: hypothetical protein NC918_00855 [Candidatus Omnitrophica bacterium]|nr:hypothetical protein [Candidatus Omnitrophota bacterium]
MPTVSHLVEKYIRNNQILENCLRKDIVSFHRLAKYLREPLEKELNKEIEESAIVMALSRIREKLQNKEKNLKEKIKIKEIEITLKSDVICLDLKKTDNVLKKIEKIQKQCSAQLSDILSITQSSHEITIVAQKKYKKKILEILKNEKLLNFEDNLSVIVLRFTKDVLYQPGFFDWIISQLSWENINIYQMVSTLTELLIIVEEKESPRAYPVILKLIKGR